MKALVKFIVSPAGRLTRIVAGISLIGIGLFAIGGTTGLIVAALATAPLASGSLDVCFFAPAFKLPFTGAKVRAMK